MGNSRFPDFPRAGDTINIHSLEYDVMESEEITYFDNPDDLTIEIHLTKAMP